MKTYNYKTIGNEPLENIIDFEQYKNKENILIQIFCGKRKNKLQSIIETIRQKLPQATCIGSSTDGEIYNSEVSTKSIVISISTFKQTSIKSASSTDASCFQKGAQLAKKLITPRTKLLILFLNSFGSNGEEFVKGIESVNKKVMICGGMAGDNALFDETFVSIQDHILDQGAVGVALDSDILEVKNDYRFNWSTIGIEHKITKAEKNRVYEINDMRTIDFYKKYLGSDLEDKQLESAIAFPLLIKKNNILTARPVIKICDDGSFLYTGNLKVGDRVKFGFGNTEMILKEPIIQNPDDYENTESFFMYSCMARRRYIPDLIHIENSAYSNIATTTGFFTYAEFFHKNGKNELFNHACTIVSLSENPKLKKDISKISYEREEVNDSYTKTIQTLTHLIDQSSKDYNEQSMNLEMEKINSQMLLTSQKIFLRHAVHETNTPISVIMSNIELYEMEYGKNQYLSTIEVALKNIFNIYDDLSYLVKKDQVDYPKKNIDLVDFIRSRIDFFNQSANQIGSEFVFNSDTPTLNINFNETKLQRIIDNNLTNAIKYTEEHSNIYISLGKELNNYVLTISSCSQYIQYPEKIFKEYYREESTKQGFGLGLSLVKRICDEEDIGIAIESNEYFTSFRYIFKMENL